MSSQPEEGTTTVGDVKISRLLDKIATNERRHTEEFMNQEIEYLMIINNLNEEIARLRELAGESEGPVAVPTPIKKPADRRRPAKKAVQTRSK